MTRPPILALPLLLLPALPAAAQEGPTFDCDDASTRSEFAICANPELAQLERAMVAAYERYAEVVGRREARAQADELLARRQACEGDVRCNAEQLIIAMEIYDQRSGRTDGTEFARLEDILPREVAPAPEPELAALPEPELPVVTEPQAELPAPTDPDIPLAAQAPLPPDVVPIPPSREVAAAEPDLSEAIEGAELASSDGATGDPDAQAEFDTPLSWAFMDLERTDRAAIQDRLAGAGFYAGATEGAWTNATVAALQDFAEEEGSGSFDLSTQTGAALLLDYIRSDAFATAFGSEQASLDAAAPQPPRPVEDAIDSTDW